MPAHAVVEHLTRDHARPALYAWVIDKDHLYDEFPDLGTNEVGVAGPSNAPQDLLERLTAGEGVQFRMLDDDGELYYTGRILAYTDDTRTALQTFPDCGDEFFGPLWDYGTPNAGAVDVQYRQGAAWVGL